VTQCRILLLHTRSFAHCRRVARVENTALRNTLFLENSLP
jgi:hypothetical protein